MNNKVRVFIALAGALVLLITRPPNTGQTTMPPTEAIDNIENSDESFLEGIETELSLAIDGGDLTLEVGSNATLSYTLTPPGYDARKMIAWGSSDPAIALPGVSSNGGKSFPIFAAGEGVATVTLVIGEGDESLTHSIRVTVVSALAEPDADNKEPDPDSEEPGDEASPDDEGADPDDTTMPDGNDSIPNIATIPETVLPEDAAIPEATTPDEGVAAAPGASTPEHGIAAIPETTVPADNATTSPEINIPDPGAVVVPEEIPPNEPDGGDAPAPEPVAPIPGVIINSGNRVMATGDVITLHYTVTPVGFDAGKRIKWSTNNANAIKLGSVSSFDGSIMITAADPGTVTVTLSISDGSETVSDAITITVNRAP